MKLNNLPTITNSNSLKNARRLKQLSRLPSLKLKQLATKSWAVSKNKAASASTSREDSSRMRRKFFWNH